MRILCFLASFLLIMCCGTKQKSISSNAKEVSEIQFICPDDGVCFFDVLKNKSLLLKHDSTNQLYPEIVDSDNVVLKYEYARNEIPNIEDGSYREIIFLEINKKDLPINLENKNLQTVKLLFARLCFCRGQTGYYKVVNGSLSINESVNEIYELKLSFKINEVPQVINIIDESFKI